MEKQIIYNVLDGEITFDPQIVEYGRLREKFNDYDDELAQSISKFYEENKSSIMDMYLGENKYYDFMFRLYAEITENIKEHMKKYINIMIDHELERDLETRNKQLSKETEIIPFVDIEIRPSDNDYISKTLYQSERKCRAGFISKEECSKMQQDAITRSFNDMTAQYESVMKQL